MSPCETTEFYSQQFLANLVTCEQASHSVSFGQLERLVRRNATMEVTQRLIGIGLVATLFFASSGAQIIVQPGYSQPRNGQQSYTGSPMNHPNPAVYQKHRSLADEFERNQVLQRVIENQILQLVHENQAQQLQQMPPGMVGFPLIHYPLRPRIGTGKLFSLTPSGIRGLHLGGYGLTRHPVLLREADEPQEQEGYVGRTQWPRSVSGGPGLDFGVETSQVHDVASDASIVGDSVNGVEDLPEPQAFVAEDSIDKLVEPRHTGEPDDAVVGSPLDRIHYDQPYDHDQHHPMNSPAMSSQFMKTANAVGQMIDKVASSLKDARSGYENRDPISSMTSHQDPAGYYQQHSQHPSSRQGQRNESPHNWNTPSTSSNNEPMTGQSFNSQKSQNPEWSSKAPAQSSQNPSAKASGNERPYQQPHASYPATSSPTNNWLTSAKQIFTGQPSYQNYQNPSYSNYQPGYQNYQNRPQNGGYRPNYNGPSPYISGPSRPTSTATASASSSANNYNYYNPYQRSPYNNNPFVGYSPYGFTGAVDQFGRAILSQLPATVNSIVANPANMEYLRNMVGQQLQRNYY